MVYTSTPKLKSNYNIFDTSSPIRTPFILYELKGRLSLLIKYQINNDRQIIRSFFSFKKKLGFFRIIIGMTLYLTFCWWSSKWWHFLRWSWWLGLSFHVLSENYHLCKIKWGNCLINSHPLCKTSIKVEKAWISLLSLPVELQSWHELWSPIFTLPFSTIWLL